MEEGRFGPLEWPPAQRRNKAVPGPLLGQVLEQIHSSCLRAQALHLQEAFPDCSSPLLFSSLDRNSTQGPPPKSTLGCRSTNTNEPCSLRAATENDGCLDHQAGSGRENTGSTHTETSPLEHRGKRILAKMPRRGPLSWAASKD